jgi:hypothetical protein
MEGKSQTSEPLAPRELGCAQRPRRTAGARTLSNVFENVFGNVVSFGNRSRETGLRRPLFPAQTLRFATSSTKTVMC